MIINGPKGQIDTDAFRFVYTPAEIEQALGRRPRTRVTIHSPKADNAPARIVADIDPGTCTDGGARAARFMESIARAIGAEIETSVLSGRFER